MLSFNRIQVIRLMRFTGSITLVDQWCEGSKVPEER